MLDVLRRGASGWLSKLILGLIIASFVAFGITTRTTGFSSTEDAVEVGSTKLSAIDLDTRYRRALNGFSAQVGHPLTKEEAISYGLPNQIMTDILANVTMTEEARVLGLGVSDDAVRQSIVDDPMFKGANGQFDRNFMRGYLNATRTSEDSFVSDRRDIVMRRQVTDALTGGLKTPNAMLEVLNRYSLEERTIRYMTLDASPPSEIADPAPDVLATYFEARKAAFKTPELQVLQLITLDPAKISKADAISDDDAKAAYTANIATYTVPEKRRIQQIPFDSKDAADAAAKRLADGLSFDALIADMKLKPEDIDQGLLDQASFLDPTVADAAFKLAKAGDVSGVISGKLRNVIVRLTEITPGSVQPFDEVKPAIKASLAAARSDSDVRNLLKSIESARDERASFSDVASRFKLDLVTTPPINKDGKMADGKPLTGVDDPAKLAKSAFESDVGNQNDPIALANGGYLFFDVVTVMPPRDRSLDEVKADITTSWKTEQARNQLSDKTKDLVARLQKGEAFDDVAKSAGLEPKTTAAFKRSDTPDGLTPAAVTSAFSGGEGTVATALSPSGGRFILQVKDVAEPAFFAEAESLKQPGEQFSQSLKTSVQNEVLRGVQAEQGVRVSQQVISQVLGLPSRQQN
jgi:peptidyl-prolyl cis-trans isomerase D